MLILRASSTFYIHRLNMFLTISIKTGLFKYGWVLIDYKVKQPEEEICRRVTYN